MDQLVNKYVKNRNNYHVTMELLTALGTPARLGRAGMIYNRNALNRRVQQILHNRAAKHTVALVLLRPKLNKNTRSRVAKYL